jgi:quercetin dioxygenase-like cupin family protein
MSSLMSIEMVRIYRAEDAEKAQRAGYKAAYVADLRFREYLDSCGVILVDIEGEGRSSPHAHARLEEVFIALSDLDLYIGKERHELKNGDVVIVEPGEEHSFEAVKHQASRLLALKFPNIKDDKVLPNSGSEN